MSTPTTTVAFSHFGFFVKNLKKMRAFYCRVLGFVETDRGNRRRASS